ncbi:hypothetical protein Bca4012_062932 [Brassica carinata]
MKCDDRCQLCGREGEYINHVLFQCDMARLSWALSCLPMPPRGWLERSIFENINYLLKISKNVNVDIRISRSWPWILWYLWKHINGYLFEGKRQNPEDIIRKAVEEADEWFLAQQIDGRMEVIETPVVRDSNVQLKLCPKGWVSCEIGMEWNRDSNVTGAAWIVRNDVGRVLHHSRRAFLSVSTVREARLQVYLWAVESMQSLRSQKVVFHSTFSELSEVVVKPSSWPALQFELVELKN